MRERLNIWMISASSGLILLALAVEPQTVFPQKMSYAAGGTVRRPSPAPRSTGALIEIEPLPRYRDVQGTAFSISVGTRWMTARHVIENCNSGRLSSPSDDTDLEELLVSQEDDVAIVRSLRRRVRPISALPKRLRRLGIPPTCSAFRRVANMPFR